MFVVGRRCASLYGRSVANLLFTPKGKVVRSCIKFNLALGIPLEAVVALKYIDSIIVYTVFRHGTTE